ncbi:MAG TPA: GNAT family N-acetyltransferase [Pedococcus sp.]|jgi:acyl-CoA hydrolase/GNAT superfamily N-acetyltransferase
MSTTEADTRKAADGDEDWRGRLVPAEQAVAAIPPGSNVYVGSACGTPRTVVRLLEGVPYEHRGTRLVHFLTDGLAVDGASLEHRTMFLGRALSEQLGEGLVEYVPMTLTDVPALLRAGRLRVDVAVVQVTPPVGGRCSLGVSVDAAPAAIAAARTVIAEVNPAMPWTSGSSEVAVADIDYFVEVAPEVVSYVHPEVGDVGERIARYVARIIDDGATLHIGFGRVPSAMLAHLTERRDLGVHSDVITEPLLDLVEAGVVTGARKGTDVGKVVTSLAMGTRRLYDALDRNPAFEFRPIDEVQSTLLEQQGLVSVTQAFRVDLTGQVCIDALGGRPYGGLAAEPDFHRAASLSPGGKAIVALASRQPDGSSAFTGRLGSAEAVGIPRHEVRWVVTEFGETYLHGRSLRERAVAMVEIAHPDDREGLLAEAVSLGLVPKDQKLRSKASYPSQEEREVALKDGTRVLVRPTRTGDAALLQDLFYRMDAEDVRTRFFRNLQSLTRNAAEHLCSVGYDQEMAFLAVVGERENERAVASGQYYVDSSTSLADVAYMVDSAWQGRGLGGTLHRLLSDYAARHGVRGFTADVLTENARMAHVLMANGDVTVHTSSGIHEMVIPVHRIDEQGR